MPTNPTAPEVLAEMGELCQQLRQQAHNESAAHKMMADAKSDRQADRSDYPGLPSRGYDWIKPEQTASWQAATAIESRCTEITALRASEAELEADVADAKQVARDAVEALGEAEARLEEAEGVIGPFADICVGRESFYDNRELDIELVSTGLNVRRARLLMSDFRKAARWLAGEGR